MTPEEPNLLQSFLSDLRQDRGAAKDPDADALIGQTLRLAQGLSNVFSPRDRVTAPRDGWSSGGASSPCHQITLAIGAQDERAPEART